MKNLNFRKVVKSIVLAVMGVVVAVFLSGVIIGIKEVLQ
jgi:hypothetical protein